MAKAGKSPGQDSQSLADRFWAPFNGYKDFFVAIKPGPKKTRPVDAYSTRGVSFPRQTSIPIDMEESGNDGEAKQVLTLSPPQPGDFTRLSHRKVLEIVDAIRWRWVRWYGKKRARASIIDFSSTTYQGEVAGAPAGPKSWRDSYMGGDEPMAKYLVLLPADYVNNNGGRQAIDRFPTIADIDPTAAMWPRDEERSWVGADASEYEANAPFREAEEKPKRAPVAVFDGWPKTPGEEDDTPPDVQ